MSTDVPEERQEVRLSDALRELPLLGEDLFLRMQAFNLEVVDHFLVDWETRLLEEYIREERTPLPTTVLVSALSQLWIFGLYELLRTWRQRATDVLRFAKEVRGVSEGLRETRLAEKLRELEERSATSESAGDYWPMYEKAVKNPEYASMVRRAVDRAERLFRRIEALRVSLAKHELPGKKGGYAMAPGYGRIDMRTGSIYWQLVLRGDEVDLVSRRTIADGCRDLARFDDVVILPENVQEKVKQFPDSSYGVKRIAVVLADGSEHGGVFVAWAKEVLLVAGEAGIRFRGDQIVDARDDPEV